MDDQHKTDYTDVINRAVVSLSELARENHTVFLDSQKLIAREILHEHREVVREAAQHHKEEMTAQRWHMGIGTVVLLVSLVAGFYISIKQLNLSRLYERSNWLEHTIDNQTAKYEKLMSAMTTVRGIRAEGQATCKNGQYTGPDPAAYQKRLYTADYNLVGAIFAPKEIFGPDIFKKIASFTSDASGTENFGICAKNATNDAVLKTQQTEISNLISDKIALIAKEKSNVEKEILGIEK